MAMITKTMRLPPRRVSTPSTTLNKRKEREDSNERPKPKPKPFIPSNPTTNLVKPDKPITGSEPSTSSAKPKGSELCPSNRLLAGYLAHEFLTKGTLLGQPWDPSRASECPSEPEQEKSTLSQIKEAEPEKYERYVEIADLLRMNGTHLPGIVNPTQLAGFLYVTPR